MSNETRGITYRTASGEIVSFNTNVVGDCRSVAIDIEPVQNLNGQDAPYPAGGGKNKFNQNAIESRSTTTNSIVNNNGVITVIIGSGSTYNGFSTSKSLRSLAPNMVAGNTYTLTVNTTGVAKIYLTNVTWASGQSMVITDELLDKNVWLYANGKGTTATIYGIQIEEGSVATAFAPYENICPISGRTAVNIYHYAEYDAEAQPTITTQLGQTVYGGTLDAMNGVLTVDRANIASYNGETLPSTWISDRDVYVPGATPTTGAQVVYKLATPLETSVTAQQLTTVLGTNCIWSDAGDVTVEYPYDDSSGNGDFLKLLFVESMWGGEEV